MDLAPGTTFVYQAQLSLSLLNPDISTVLANIANVVNGEGIAIQNSNYTGQGSISQALSAANPFGPGLQYQITLNCSAIQDMDSGLAQFYLDNAITQATGNVPVSSSIPTIGNSSTGAATQNAPAGGVGTSVSNVIPNLLGISSGSMLILLIVVVLVGAIILFPEAPARIARSFAT